ncbi:hypothetical protein JCM8547_002252 [Rhodosporidiobolus lusitaniae]
MSYKNPYANPSNPYAAYQPSASSSSSAAVGPYYPQPPVPYAAAGASTSAAYPAYPGVAGYPPVAGPIPPPAPTAGPSLPVGAYDMEQAQQASIYTPEASRSTRNSVVAAGQKGKARTTVLRKGGGEVWEDQSLLEWDPSHFRLFIGDLDPAIGDEAFKNAFSGPRYPSYVKSKVIRDKYTNKGKGYGFVSYSDPEDFLKAWKEMNGKYVGTRPVTIKKAQAGVKAVNIGSRKARELESKQQQKTGTVSYERANAEESGHRAIPGEKGYGPQRSRKQYIRR